MYETLEKEQDTRRDENQDEMLENYENEEETESVGDINEGPTQEQIEKLLDEMEKSALFIAQMKKNNPDGLQSRSKGEKKECSAKSINSPFRERDDEKKEAPRRRKRSNAIHRSNIETEKKSTNEKENSSSPEKIEDKQDEKENEEKNEKQESVKKEKTVPFAIRSMEKIRASVIAAKENNTFEEVLTYKKKDSVFSLLKKAFGKNTDEDEEEKEEKTVEQTELEENFRAMLIDALKRKNVEEVKELITAKIGQGKRMKFLLAAVELICKQFGGEKNKKSEFGASLLEKIASLGNSIGTAISNVQGGIKSIQGTIKSIKEMVQESGKNILSDGIVKGADHLLKKTSDVAILAEGANIVFNVVQTAIGNVLPIIGSVINIAINGVKAIIKAYEAVKAFINESKAAKKVRQIIENGRLTKFIKEKKSALFKRMSSGFDEKQMKARRDELRAEMKTRELCRAEQEELENLEHYLMYKKLGSDNKKRGIRSVTIVGEKLAGIGAEIAAIVGVATEGVGTAVGAGIKVAIKGEQVSRKVYNTVKKLGRDYVPEKISVFNKDKSTDNKMKEYYATAYTLYNRIGALPPYESDNSAVEQLYKDREDDLKLANCSVFKLAKKHDEGFEQARDYLISRMRKRE